MGALRYLNHGNISRRLQELKYPHMFRISGLDDARFTQQAGVSSTLQAISGLSHSIIEFFWEEAF